MNTLAAPNTTAVLYRIDAEDVLIDVGGAWHVFAEANGGLGEVVGRPLWDFVGGADVVAVWSLLLRRARVAGGPFAFLYRCDAPGVRRLLQMELEAEVDDCVAFRSTQIRVSATPTYVGEWESEPSEDAVVVCGWCARVRLDSWVAAERATAELGLTGLAARLSHGICETCARELASPRPSPER